MNDTLQDLMREATRLTRAGCLNEATEALQRGLGGVTVPLQASESARIGSRAEQGEFSVGTHTHATLTRGYKFYAPPEPRRGLLPLVVMLHGCKQNPDDFAAGTGMNQRAREQGFFVLYPAQAQRANPAGCWNWFKSNHQQRGSGEPAVLASMTQAVIKIHGVDPRRVYIAGLSAGGAMAAIVARAYPELFAAVGIHSGLPCGAVHDAMSALALMKNGLAAAPSAGEAAAASTQPAAHIPTIVFHGDQDTTVHPRNGERLVADALRGLRGGADEWHSAVEQPARVEHGMSAQGRRFTRVIHRGARDDALAEHWLVHGAGHAWSGGDARGSYTDPKGPDATREMLRFFFEHLRRGHP